MAYYVRYLVQTNRLGKARPTLYVHTSNENKDENQIWYAFGTYETSPNLPWDTSGETVAGSASASWSQEIAKDGGSNGTEMIRASFDRAAMVLTLSSGSGAYDASTQTYAEPSGLFAEPAKFDCSNYQWTQGTANTEYAQLNADADFAVESQEQEEDQSGELFPSDVTLYPPVINSATQTDKREITVSWAGMVIVGNKGTEVAPQLTLQYSADGGETWVNSGASVSGQTGTVAVRNLNAATTYYWRMIASWPTLGGGSVGSNEDKFASTITPLKPPVIGTVAALDGEGSVSWSEISGAVSYLVALVDAENDVPASSVASQGGTTWSFNESSGLTAGMTVQGKWVRVKAVATSNSIEYENSEWSAAKLIPDNRTPAGEEPVTPVEQIMTRRIYKAIPYIDVPVEQIGGGGSSKKDVATIEYLEANYVKSSGEIPASQLPFAVYGTTDDDSATTVVNPAYVKGAIDDINQVYAITDIQIASNSSTKFAGVATSVTGTAEDYTLITRKGVYDFARNASNLGTGTVANARLNKAKAAGGSGNAGIVWVNSTAGNDGLVISSASGEEGLIKVNFATYGTTSATDTHTVVNPSYLNSAITALNLGTAATYAVGTAQGNIPVLGANGKLSIDMMPARVIGGEYLGEVASATAMVGKSNATVGDFVKRTDTGTYWMLGVDADGAYATAANWFEYAGAVTSVNGAVGAVTQAQLGLETTLTATSDTAFPSSKAVATYVTGRGYLTSGSNLNASKLTSGTVDAARLPWSLATWTDGTTHYSTTGTGLVTQTYLSNAFTDYGFGAAAKKGVATTVTSGGTDLVTGGAVYTAINDNISGLDYSDVGAAAATHTHALSDITYSGATGYAAGTTISTTQSNNTDGKLATTLAVYKFVSTNYAEKTHTHVSADITNAATTAAEITTDNASLAQAKAVRLYINSLGLGDASKKGVATTITSTETGLTPGSVVFNYAAPKTHQHTSEQISDAIATVADPSVNTTFNKVVKTESAWGQIGASLIPIDEQSLEVYTSAGTSVIQVSDSYVNSLITNKGYITSATAANTYARKDSLFDTWTAGTSYVVGDVVWYDNTLWKCHTANTASLAVGSNNAPSTYPSSDGYTNCWDAVNVGDLIGSSGRYETTLTRTSAATSYNITHNLGSQYVDVQLYDSSQREVFAAVVATSATTVQISFGAALESGVTETYHVVVRK